MMKTKNLVLLGIVLAVLLGINLMQKSGHKKATSQSSVAEIIADGFPIAARAEKIGRSDVSVNQAFVG